MPVFIEALFTMANGWKQPCPSADVWIHEMWYVRIVGYYSAIMKFWYMLQGGSSKTC